MDKIPLTDYAPLCSAVADVVNLTYCNRPAADRAGDFIFSVLAKNYGLAETLQRGVQIRDAIEAEALPKLESAQDLLTTLLVGFANTSDEDSEEIRSAMYHGQKGLFSLLVLALHKESGLAIDDLFTLIDPKAAQKLREETDHGVH
jgi:hypothetical protein